jgi:ferritin-like metal-binding protein YciE
VKKAFEVHLGQTARQVQRLEQIADNVALTLGGRQSPAMRGLVEESRRLINGIGGDEALDAGRRSVNSP